MLILWGAWQRVSRRRHSGFLPLSHSILGRQSQMLPTASENCLMVSFRVRSLFDKFGSISLKKFVSQACNFSPGVATMQACCAAVAQYAAVLTANSAAELSHGHDTGCPGCYFAASCSSHHCTVLQASAFRGWAGKACHRCVAHNRDMPHDHTAYWS